MMKSFGLSVLGLVLASSVYAGSVEKFDYPELMVVPRASDRLQSEAEMEPSRKYSQYIPLQLSALTTVVAGIASFDPNDRAASYTGVGVGVAWLLVAGTLVHRYHPYASSWERIKAMPRGTVREQLAYERAAEEEIHSASAAGERIRWLSILSNLGASAVMIAKGTPAGSGVQGLQSGQAFAIGSAVVALAPLIFPFHWSRVCAEQMEYKKRIYGPVARATFLADSVGGIAPGVTLSLRF